MVDLGHVDHDTAVLALAWLGNKQVLIDLVLHHGWAVREWSGKALLDTRTFNTFLAHRWRSAGWLLRCDLQRYLAGGPTYARTVPSGAGMTFGCTRRANGVGGALI